MRTVAGIVLLAAVFSGSICADFSYTSTTQLTGGALYDAVLAMGSLGRGARKPIVAAHLIKGNRMATVTKDHATVVLLDNETIYEIDFVKKTYLIVTFAQMKQKLDQSIKVPRAAFQVSSRFTGRTKAIGFLSAKESIVTMDMEGASEKGPQAVTHILVDSWLLTEPGYGEAEEFRRKLAAKLSYAYAAGIFEIGTVKPELLPGFEELAKVSNQVDEIPVESAIKMGGPGSGVLTPIEDAKTGIVSETLSRIGSIGRKKANRNSASTAGEQDILVEMTIELSNFSAGTADESKFNVPGGFKEVKPSAPADAHEPK